MSKWRALAASLILLVFSALTALTLDSGLADPVIPTGGGTALQTNVTGYWNAVAVESDDDFVAAGSKGAVSLNAITQIYALTNDAGLVGSYNGDGTNKWIRSKDFGDLNFFNGIAVDSSGNSYVVGHTATAPNGRWAWIVKYDSSGTEAWSLNLTVSGYGYATLFGVVLSGSTLVAVGGVRDESPPHYPLLARISTGGSVSGTNVFTGMPCTSWGDVALGDETGTFFVSGLERGGAACDEEFLGCAGKIDAIYAIDWHDCDGESSSALEDLAANGEFVAFSGALIIDDPPPIYTAVQRYSFAGTSAWVAYHDEAQAIPLMYAMGVAVDSSGNIFASGTNGTHDLEAVGTEVPFTQAKAISLKYDEDGALQWATEYSGATGEQVESRANALDSQPRLLVAGSKFKAADPITPSLHPIVLRYESL